MGGVAVLGGIGTAALLARRGRAARLLIATTVALLVGADLRTRIPDQTFSVPESKAMAARCRARARDPLSASEFLVGPVTEPCIWQIQHRKSLVNPCDTRASFPPLVFELNDTLNCSNLRRLASLGVRYVISHRRFSVFSGCDGRERVVHLLSRDEYFTVERIRLTAR